MLWSHLTTLLRGKQRAARRDRWCLPALEVLEDRTAPVIGNRYQLPALAPAPPGTPDAIYDGVAQIINQNTINANPGNPNAWVWGSGSLLPDGRHILTAAHVLVGYAGAPVGQFPSAERVGFYLVRNDGPGGAAINRTINLNIPVGQPYQIPEPYYLPGPFPYSNDIALATIPDQIVAGPTRQMVAPYYGPQIGFQAYAGNAEVGQQYTVVGYGASGTGAVGMMPMTTGIGLKRLGYNTFDANASILNNAVQTVGVTGAPVGGNFRLQWTDANGNVATSGDIAFNAPANGAANSVQTLLQAARTPGGAIPLAANVQVFGGPGINAPGDTTTWFISFTGALANTAVNPVIAFNSPAAPLMPAAAGTSQSVRYNGGANEQQTLVLGGGANGGTFQLQFTPPAGPAVTTANIAWNAPANGAANSVQTLLEAAADVNGNRPLNGNVSVTAIAGGGWNVVFINRLANTNVNQLVLITNNLNPAGATININTPTQGAATNAPGFGALAYDFDNGQPANNALGLFYGLNNAGVPAVNEVQRVTLANATGGTFTLTYTALPGGPAGAPVTGTTGNIAWNAAPGVVQAALVAILGANVAVAAAPGGGWDVTFNNALGGNNLNLLTGNAAGLAGAGARVSVVYQTRGQSENYDSYGDSGGPALINGEIAGLVSTSATYPGQVPAVLAAANNDAFGEIGKMTRVSDYVNSFITPNTSGNYDLVLDMNFQMLGVDGTNDPITITASRGGGVGNPNLILTVTDPNSPQYSGTYFSGIAANINSLTVRGAAGNDTIQLQGALGVGPITIDGRGGNNTVIVGDANTGNLNDVSSNIIINGGAGGTNTLQVNDVAAPAGRTYTLTASTLGWGAAPNIQFSNITNLTLNAGNGGNIVNAQATNAGSTTTIYTGTGINTVNVGSANDATSTLNNIQGNLVVSGCGGTDALNANDQAAAAGQNYVVNNETLTRGRIRPITFFCIATVKLNGSGASKYIVQATALGTSTTINVNGGAGIIRVSNAQNTLDDLQGPLTITDERGTKTNAITIDDSGNPVRQAFTTSGDRVMRAGGPIINTLNYGYRLVNFPRQPQNLPGMGGLLGNTLEVDSTLAGARDLIRTGNYDDTITFNLTDPLQNAQMLIDGGAGQDRVVIAQGLVSTDQVKLVNTEDLEVDGGAFAPGGVGAAASFLVTGSYTQTAGGSLDLDLGNPAIGSDQLLVQGPITLGGSLNLNLLPGFAGKGFLLIRNLGTTPVSGQFAGLAEGATLTLNGQDYRLSYAGGHGNDVVLIAVQATPTALIAAQSPSALSQPLAFTATVTAGSGSNAPARTITITVKGIPPLANGRGNYATSSLPGQRNRDRHHLSTLSLNNKDEGEKKEEIVNTLEAALN